MGGQITEIEQAVIRNVDAAKRVEAVGTPNAVFLQAIPEGQRMSRAKLIRTANMYFSGMQKNDGKGVYPFADDCDRIENGRQTTNRPTPAGEKRPDPTTATNYSAQWSCLEQFKSGLLHFVTRIRDRRFVAVDQERGLVLAFGFFDHSAGDTRNFEAPNGRHVTAGPRNPGLGTSPRCSRSRTARFTASRRCSIGCRTGCFPAGAAGRMECRTARRT